MGNTEAARLPEPIFFKGDSRGHRPACGVVADYARRELLVPPVPSQDDEAVRIVGETSRLH
jgi:hypothetical protein